MRSFTGDIFGNNVFSSGVSQTFFNGKLVSQNGRPITVDINGEMKDQVLKITIESVDKDPEIVYFDTDEVWINVTGDCSKIDTVSGKVTVFGDVGSTTTQSGSIEVNGNTKSATTMSGSIWVGGDVAGECTTMSGNISHRH